MPTYHLCRCVRLNGHTYHSSHHAFQVVAQPDDKWGEVPCAFVSLKDGHALTEEELIAFARDNLAHYKARSDWIQVAGI